MTIDTKNQQPTGDQRPPMPSHTPSVANARLIAAAPDMLAALKAVVRTRDKLAFDQAREAIAKAEGHNA